MIHGSGGAGADDPSTLTSDCETIDLEDAPSHLAVSQYEEMDTRTDQLLPTTREDTFILHWYADRLSLLANSPMWRLRHLIIRLSLALFVIPLAYCVVWSIKLDLVALIAGILLTVGDTMMVMT